MSNFLPSLQALAKVFRYYFFYLELIPTYYLTGHCCDCCRIVYSRFVTTLTGLVHHVLRGADQLDLMLTYFPQDLGFYTMVRTT